MLERQEEVTWHWEWSGAGPGVLRAREQPGLSALAVPFGAGAARQVEAGPQGVLATCHSILGARGELWEGLSREEVVCSSVEVFEE